MTTSIRSLCILAGLSATPAALAQAITFDASGGGVIAVGETVTISMSASYGGTDYALAGIATSIRVNESQGEFSNLRLVAPMDGPGTSAGVIAVGGGIDGILAGQLNFIGASIYADPTNPIAFWEADFTVGALVGGVALDIETVTTRYDVFVDMGSSTSESRLAELEEGRLVIVVPAPASGLALLGGLSFATRRRR